MKYREEKFRRIKREAVIRACWLSVTPAYHRFRRAVIRAVIDDAASIARTEAASRNAIDHALRLSPFYGRLTSRFPRNYLPQLEDLPLVSRTTLARNLPRMVAQLADGQILSKGHCRVINTSGSSGEPIAVLHDDATRLSSSAFYSRLIRRYRLPTSGDYIDLGLRNGAEPLVVLRPGLGIYRAWNLSRFQPEFAKDIQAEYRSASTVAPPKFVVGAPSRLETYADAMAALDLSVAPRIVFSTYEYLTPAVRQRISNYFGCAIVSLYGCAEIGMVAWECTSGSYHYFPDLHAVEILDSAGKQATAGSEGALTVSSLSAYSFPILRYAVGDRAVAASGPCPCGCALPHFLSLAGRQAQQICTRDGRRVSEYYVLDQVASRCPTQFQLQQWAAGALKLVLPSSGAIDDEVVAELKGVIARYLREDVELSVSKESDFILAANGKMSAMYVSPQLASGM